MPRNHDWEVSPEWLTKPLLHEVILDEDLDFPLLYRINTFVSNIGGVIDTDKTNSYRKSEGRKLPIHGRKRVDGVLRVLSSYKVDGILHFTYKLR